MVFKEEQPIVVPSFKLLTILFFPIFGLDCRDPEHLLRDDKLSTLGELLSPPKTEVIEMP